MVTKRSLASADEVAAYLQKPVNTLYAWRLKRVGPKAVKVGRTLRYRWEDVDRWIDQQADKSIG